MLENFTRALEQHKREINPTQYWRYKGGQVPKLLRWLVKHPKLAEALAEDARALSDADRAIVPQPEAA